jgi:hypothetical protein
MERKQHEEGRLRTKIITAQILINEFGEDTELNKCLMKVLESVPGEDCIKYLEEYRNNHKRKEVN